MCRDSSQQLIRRLRLRARTFYLVFVHTLFATQRGRKQHVDYQNPEEAWRRKRLDRSRHDENVSTFWYCTLHTVSRAKASFITSMQHPRNRKPSLENVHLCLVMHQIQYATYAIRCILEGHFRLRAWVLHVLTMHIYVQYVFSMKLCVCADVSRPLVLLNLFAVFHIKWKGKLCKCFLTYQ